MLNPSDIYTSVGSTTLYGCWTPNVTKFDASSFYNWEQDNLPVYDLDERTSYLWERLGYPTSSLNGFAFVVSADATDNCNTNIFTTLSACIRSLPEVINFPVLIEVASFGNLGSLTLSNKIFGPRGSIEIINRNFGKGYSFVDTGTNWYSLQGETKLPTNVYALASSVQINNSTLASENGSGKAIPSIARDFQLSKVYSLNSTVVSSTSYDSRITDQLTLFTRKILPKNNRLTAALSSRNTGAPFASYDSANTSALVNFTAYESNPESYENLSTYDASCFNEEDSYSEIVWNSTSLSDYSVALAYTNKLNEIKINNFNGPIFIRNFTVDGGGDNKRDYGINIRNSSVVIENCSVSRCNLAGLYAENSNVILTRGFVAYRNYPVYNGVRSGTPWLDKIKSSNKYNNYKNLGAGIELVNSELNFSSTYERDFEYSLSATKNFYTDLSGINAAGLSSLPASNWLFCLSRNDVGIKSFNSRIIGGKNELGGYSLPNITDESYFDSHNLILELNTDSGLLLENSKLEYSGRLNAFGNFIGINSINSNIMVDMVNCRNNQKEGIYLKNSKLNYNKDCYKPNQAYAEQTHKIHQVSLLQNGVHIKLDQSSFEPTNVSSIPTNYERVVASASFGLNNFSIAGNRGRLPSMIVDSNSKLRLVSLGLQNSRVIQDQAYFGAGISVINNSELILQGTKDFVTKIVGPSTREDQLLVAGLFANNNSTIKIQGPTVIAQFGVDVLVDNNSKLEFTPHRTQEALLDISGFNLDNPKNHTSVELHSTRSCLVADNNSLITMEDLGDYSKYWSRGPYGSGILLSGVDYDIVGGLNYSTYVSAGSMQFYANPNIDGAYPTYGIQQLTSVGLYNSNDVQATNGFNYITTEAGPYIGSYSNNYRFSGATWGGMCLRALNGSKVNLDNVHFPCGFWNPSSVFFDYNNPQGNCCRLYIWNISDNSQLDAKLISVSGLHPADAAYFGPSGVWSSGAGAYASGAPSSTPNTSSISILDYFGRAPGAHKYANSIATNQGPFRLFFSTDPFINWATPINTTGFDGVATQVYSQGYQFSGDLTFSSASVSSLYKSLLKDSGSNSFVGSGFYYASSVVTSPFTLKALLDESAANTFANAKHNSVGKSGLAKVVDIYFPYKDVYGGDSSTIKSLGRGVKSVNTFDLEKDN